MRLSEPPSETSSGSSLCSLGDERKNIEPMIEAIYNTIGSTYDTTRRPDPEIVKTLIRLLEPTADGRYLDVACGSGNYTIALAQLGILVEGTDLSEGMLSKARTKNPMIGWHQGDARALPFQDAVFNGAICTLATHHMEQFESAFKEVYRVMKPGRFVILTATPEQMSHYWLWHYFPRMMEDSAQRMSSFPRIETAYRDAGFINIKQEPFFVTDTLTDWFLYAGKHRPEMYLDPAVRAGISSFHVSTDEGETTKGLTSLKRDIESGNIQDIIKRYDTHTGEYLFVLGEKR